VARRLILPFALWACLSAGASAQGLPDPTRPPGQVADEVLVPGSGLQSIIRPVNGKGKARALIDGQIVSQGDMLGEARVVAIRADSVVLEHADGSRETLTTTPDVTKSPVRSPSSLRR